MLGSDSHQESAGKQIPALVFPPPLTLIKSFIVCDVLSDKV